MNYCMMKQIKLVWHYNSHPHSHLCTLYIYRYIHMCVCVCVYRGKNLTLRPGLESIYICKYSIMNIQFGAAPSICPCFLWVFSPVWYRCIIGHTLLWAARSCSQNVSTVKSRLLIVLFSTRGFNIGLSPPPRLPLMIWSHKLNDEINICLNQCEK